MGRYLEGPKGEEGVDVRAGDGTSGPSSLIWETVRDRLPALNG